MLGAIFEATSCLCTEGVPLSLKGGGLILDALAALKESPAGSALSNVDMLEFGLCEPL